MPLLSRKTQKNNDQVRRETFQLFKSGQAVNLSDWNGDLRHEGWRKLSREVKAKLIPSWVLQELSELEAELVAERTRREDVERRDQALQAQIKKEVQAQQGLKRERDETVAALRTEVEGLDQAKSESDARASKLSKQLSEAETQLNQERDHAAKVTARLKAKIASLELAQLESEVQTAKLSQRLREVETQLQEAQNRGAALEIADKDFARTKTESGTKAPVASHNKTALKNNYGPLDKFLLSIPALLVLVCGITVITADSRLGNIIAVTCLPLAAILLGAAYYVTPLGD